MAKWQKSNKPVNATENVVLDQEDGASSITGSNSPTEDGESGPTTATRYSKSCYKNANSKEAKIKNMGLYATMITQRIPLSIIYVGKISSKPREDI